VLGIMKGCGEKADDFHRTRSKPDGSPAIAAVPPRLPMPASRKRSTTSTRTAPRRRKTTRWSICRLSTVFGERMRDPDLVQQVDDRPHAFGRRRHRGRVFAADHARRRHPADHQLRQSRPGIELDVVPNVKREADVAMVLSNSFGFGGQNACLVMARKPSKRSRSQS
jgi:3-oxoacyl-[acyl-carrier-protein] synthase II